MMLYQKTYGKNTGKNTVVAIVGYANGDPDTTTESDMGMVVLQPLEIKSRLGSEPLPEGEYPVSYSISGVAYCVPFTVFFGEQESGKPNYEAVPLEVPVDYLNQILQSEMNKSLFSLHTSHIQYRIRVQHKMLHVLGYYRNRLDRQIVRFIGTATGEGDTYAVVQDIDKGSLDPVIVRPVGTTDPVTEDGRRDIWNGLQLIPMKEFTSLYWFSETDCRLLYEYIGLSEPRGAEQDGRSSTDSTYSILYEDM